MVSAAAAFIMEALRQSFIEHGQGHVFASWDTLSDAERNDLLADAKSVPLDELKSLFAMAAARRMYTLCQSGLVRTRRRVERVFLWIRLCSTRCSHRGAGVVLSCSRRCARDHERASGRAVVVQSGSNDVLFVFVLRR